MKRLSLTPFSGVPERRTDAKTVSTVFRTGQKLLKQFLFIGVRRTPR